MFFLCSIKPFLSFIGNSRLITIFYIKWEIFFVLQPSLSLPSSILSHRDQRYFKCLFPNAESFWLSSFEFLLSYIENMTLTSLELAVSLSSVPGCANTAQPGTYQKVGFADSLQAGSISYLSLCPSICTILKVPLS